MIAASNANASFYGSALSQMGDLRSRIETLQQQISSGERITKSSEDPVGSARLRSLSRSQRLADVNTANATTVSRDLAQSSGQIDTIANLLIRVRELAVLAASDSGGADQRQAVAIEVEELRLALLDGANALSGSGRALFGGATSTPPYAVDGAGNVSYLGSASSGSLPIAEGVDVMRGVTGPEFLHFTDALGNPSDVFALTKTMVDELRSGSDPVTAAHQVAEGLSNALDNIGKTQTVLGTRLNWIENVQQQQRDNTMTRAQEGNSIGAADLATSITQMQELMVVLEASQASFARLTSLSLFEAI